MKEIKCGCGSKQGIHILGNDSCFREIVPKNEEPIQVYNGWSVPIINGTRNTITDYTLHYQRGIRFDKDSNQWHRPKERGNDWFESRGWD